MNEPEQREHFWQGLLAGLVMSSALVGGLLALWARFRGRSAETPPGPRKD